MTKFRTIVDQYFEETTVHGFSYVHSRNAFCIKLLWFLVISGGFVVAGCMISNMVEDWQTNPTITTLDSIATSIKEVQFPTVTVCPEMYTQPDNWALPEMILNAIPFECYQSTKLTKVQYPACNETQEARNDFGQVLSVLASHLKKQVFANGKLGMPGSLVTDEMVKKTACLMKDQKLSLGKLLQKYVEYFGKEWSALYFLYSIGDYDNANQDCCHSAQYCDVIYAQLMAGDIFLTTNFNMPLGTFLRNFVNLTGTLTFDHTSELNELTSVALNWCSKLSKFDHVLHELFVHWTNDLGLNGSSSNGVSLFEIPSMLALRDLSQASRPTVVQGIPYGLCQNQVDPSSYHHCVTIWNEYIYKGQEHPCERNDNPSNPCCHFWTKIMDQNLELIMKVMKVATGRGQNLIDIWNILELHRKPESQYQFNPDDKGYYKSQKAYDPTAYIRNCKHSGNISFVGISQSRDTTIENCNLFKPVVTDMGICYSFNAVDMKSVLKDSKFKSTFMDSYMDELGNNHKIVKGERPGIPLALHFDLDNNALFRHHIKSGGSFRIAVTSKSEVFQIRSIAKLARPGYKLEIEVSPVEVVSTPQLKGVSINKRDCRFQDEGNGFMEILEDYSQSGCLFECVLKKAREFCRCTMWNMPVPAMESNWTICDTFGNSCFDEIMDQPHIDDDCNCPKDCNLVKFAVASKEMALDPELQCTQFMQEGRKLIHTKGNLLDSDLLYGYYKFPHYIGMPEADKNASYSTKRAVFDVKFELCSRMLKENVVFVSVNFGTSTFVRTVMDKRVSFSDKLSSFGGTLGLFTGMSLLSMFEVVFWIIRITGQYILSKH